MPLTYNVIASTTLGSNASSVQFTGFSGYTDLIIIGSWRYVSSGNDLGLRFNSDASNGNYPAQQIVGENISAVANSNNGTSGRAVNNGFTSDDHAFEIHIMDYANTAQYKPYQSRFSGNNSWGMFAGTWLSNSAITTIDLVKSDGTGTIAADSVFTLIGVLRA